MNLSPLQWKHRVLTTGPPRKSFSQKKKKKNYYFIFWPCPAESGIVVPQTGIKTANPALEGQNLYHRAAREVPYALFLTHLFGHRKAVASPGLKALLWLPVVSSTNSNLLITTKRYCPPHPTHRRQAPCGNSSPLCLGVGVGWGFLGGVSLEAALWDDTLLGHWAPEAGHSLPQIRALSLTLGPATSQTPLGWQPWLQTHGEPEP